jgi:hypothetical protein
MASLRSALKIKKESVAFNRLFLTFTLLTSSTSQRPKASLHVGSSTHRVEKPTLHVAKGHTSLLLYLSFSQNLAFALDRQCFELLDFLADHFNVSGIRNAGEVDLDVEEGA